MTAHLAAQLAAAVGGLPSAAMAGITHSHGWLRAGTAVLAICAAMSLLAAAAAVSPLVCRPSVVAPGPPRRTQAAALTVGLLLAAAGLVTLVVLAAVRLHALTDQNADAGTASPWGACYEFLDSVHTAITSGGAPGQDRALTAAGAVGAVHGGLGPAEALAARGCPAEALAPIAAYWANAETEGARRAAWEALVQLGGPASEPDDASQSGIYGGGASPGLRRAQPDGR